LSIITNSAIEVFVAVKHIEPINSQFLISIPILSNRKFISAFH